MVQGKPVLNERRSLQDFYARFYRHADDEDLPGDDIWHRYIRSRYVPITATADVTGGKLTLACKGFGDPHACPMSALVVFPETSARQGEAYIQELWQRLKREFDRSYRQVTPPREHDAISTGAVDRAGPMIFAMSSTEALDPMHVRASASPVERLDVVVAKGITVPIALGIASRKQTGLRDVRVELPGLNIDVFRVRSKTTRLTDDGAVYANLPRVLDPVDGASSASSMAVSAGRPLWLWLDVRAGDKTRPGRYTGTLVLTYEDGLVQRLPLAATVPAWFVPPADIPVGYLGIAPTYPDTPYPAVAAKRQREFDAAVAFVRSQGMTAASGGLGGPVLKRYVDGRPLLDLGNVDRTMARLAPAFKAGVLSYLGLEPSGLSMRRVEDTQDRYRKPYVEVLRDVLAMLDEARRRRGWLPIVFVIGDEPDKSTIERPIELAKAFKAANPNAKTAVFTSFTEPAKDPRARMAGIVDEIYLNAHSAAAVAKVASAGSKCRLYNQTGRYRRGLYLFAMAAKGCRGHMQFAFHAAHADQWYDLDGREADIVAVFTHPDGRLRPSADAMIYREAVTDYRIVMLLAKTIAARSTHPVAAEAGSWLQDMVARMAIGSQSPSPWRDSEIEFDTWPRDPLYRSVDAVARPGRRELLRSLLASASVGRIAAPP